MQTKNFQLTFLENEVSALEMLGLGWLSVGALLM